MRETMFRRSLGLGWAAAFAAVAFTGRPAVAQEPQHEEPHHHAPGMPTTTGGDGSVPLYDNLGDLSHKVTASAEAQKYFDQGLRLTYAFNHDEAIASYTAATKRDSTCAMCWWGIAYALGPNINAPMDTAAYRPAYDAIQKALRLAPKTKRYERDMIEAMAKRYGPKPVANRASLDSAYATAMKAVAKTYPDDPEAQTLYAEALMDLTPWNYWDARGTRPRAGTLETVATLERSIKKYPTHIGACHFYIHIVEASTTPERALPCADMMAKEIPGAGHLVHMPSHIYMRVGRYDLVADHNHEAVAEDQTYIQDRKPTGFYKYTYYPHNWHMLWMGLIQLGRGAEAINASRELVKVIPVDVVGTVPPLELYFPPPYWTLVRFGKYDEMLAEPAPATSLKYTTAMWRYSRGLALAARGRAGEAKAELDSVSATAAATSRRPARESIPRSACSPSRSSTWPAGWRSPPAIRPPRSPRSSRRSSTRMSYFTMSRRPGTTRSGRSSPRCTSRWATRRWRRNSTVRTWCTTRITGGRSTDWPAASRPRRSPPKQRRSTRSTGRSGTRRT